MMYRIILNHGKLKFNFCNKNFINVYRKDQNMESMRFIFQYLTKIILLKLHTKRNYLKLEKLSGRKGKIKILLQSKIK